MADHPDPRALRAFCSVVEHGSLTRAAAVLGVPQSALSRRIAALERLLGGRLFHRTGRGAVPTDLAARLQTRARAILAESDALLEEARGERASPAGTVDLALVPAVSRPTVSALATRLSRDYPRIRLRAVEGYSGQVEEWLASGRVDIGLFNRYGRGSVRGAELYLQADIAVVLPRGRFAIRGRELPFRALAALPLVLPPRPNSLVSALSDLASKQGLVLHIALEAGAPAMIRDAVANAGYCTLVPAHLAQREYSESTFAVARLVRPSLRQKTWLAYTSQRPASRAVRVVGRLLRELAPTPAS
jgi:DNA-binding transcriptional LysR family regulator